MGVRERVDGDEVVVKAGALSSEHLRKRVQFGNRSHPIKGFLVSVHHTATRFGPGGMVRLEYSEYRGGPTKRSLLEPSAAVTVVTR